MVDITLQVIRVAPDWSVQWTQEQQAMRWRRGDFVDGWRADKLSTFDESTGNWNYPSAKASPTFAYIHIRDVPNARAARLKEKLLQKGVLIQASDDPDYPYTTEVRRCKWRIPPAALPAAAVTALTNDHQMTVTWTQAKRFIRNKIINADTPYDPTADNEDTELTDSDI